MELHIIQFRVNKNTYTYCRQNRVENDLHDIKNVLPFLEIRICTNHIIFLIFYIQKKNEFVCYMISLGTTQFDIILFFSHDKI